MLDSAFLCLLPLSVSESLPLLLLEVDELELLDLRFCFEDCLDDVLLFDLELAEPAVGSGSSGRENGDLLFLKIIYSQFVLKPIYWFFVKCLLRINNKKLICLLSQITIKKNKAKI